MSGFFKYAIVLASGFAIGLYVNGTISFHHVPRLPRIDEINVLIGNNFERVRPEATAIVADPIDTRRVDEDLDFLIAKRIATLEGWQAFLVAHSGGALAESAEAEIDKLALLAKASEPAAAEVSDRAVSEVKVESAIAGPTLASEAAAPPRDVCNHVADCLGESRSDASGLETEHIASDSEPAQLRPQVGDVTDSPDTAAAQPPYPAKVGPDEGAKPLHHRTAVYANFQRKRRCAFGFECQWRTQTLPPILLALFGMKTRHSTRPFGQVFADARPGDLRGR